MAKKRLFFIFSAFFASAFIVIAVTRIFHSDVIDSRKGDYIVQTASSYEKVFFSELFKEVFLTSPAGYTLFFDKPMALIFLGHRGNSLRKNLLQALALPLLRAHPEFLNSPNYVIIVEGNIHSYLYLLNKKAFLKTVEQNAEIFRKILGEDFSPDQLLHSIETRKCTVSQAVKRSHLLFGILFGFGTTNALNFERRDFLESTRYRQNMPPWKGSFCLDNMDRNDAVLFTWRRKAGIADSCTKDFPPTFVDDAAVQKELADLSKKLLLVDKDECYTLASSIDFPPFVGDLESEDTKLLIKNYTEQKEMLTKLIKSEDFFEKVVKQFYSQEGEENV